MWNSSRISTYLIAELKQSWYNVLEVLEQKGNKTTLLWSYQISVTLIASSTISGQRQLQYYYRLLAEFFTETALYSYKIFQHTRKEVFRTFTAIPIQTLYIVLFLAIAKSVQFYCS